MPSRPHDVTGSSTPLSLCVWTALFFIDQSFFLYYTLREVSKQRQYSSASVVLPLTLSRAAFCLIMLRTITLHAHPSSKHSWQVRLAASVPLKHTSLKLLGPPG
jgi:hypothetical protein